MVKTELIQWWGIGERLPAPRARVLVQETDTVVQMAYYGVDGKFWDDGEGYIELDKVECWAEVDGP